MPRERRDGGGQGEHAPPTLSWRWVSQARPRALDRVQKSREKKRPRDQRAAAQAFGSRNNTMASAARSCATRAAVGLVTSLTNTEKMSGFSPGAPTTPDRLLTLARVPVFART